MGSSDVRNCRKVIPDPKTRAPRGSNGLPRAGRELIEDGCILLWHQAKQKRFTPVFWTVTIPSAYDDGTPFEESDYIRLLKAWPVMVKRIFEEVARLCERRGLPNRWLYVVEPQTERWTKDGVFAPHLHAVLPNRWVENKRPPLDAHLGFASRGAWAITLNETDAIVHRCMSNALGRPVNSTSACNIQSIKGMSKLYFYLSKLNKISNYIQKSSKVLQSIRQSSYSNYMPSNWYGCDKMTRQEVRASVTTFSIGEGTTGEVVQQLMEMSETFESDHGRPLLTRPHIVDRETEEGLVPVAVVCRVKRMTDIGHAIDAIAALDLCQIHRNFNLTG
jgi:hypothetical protein